MSFYLLYKNKIIKYTLLKLCYDIKFNYIKLNILRMNFFEIYELFFIIYYFLYCFHFFTSMFILSVLYYDLKILLNIT